MAAKSKTDLRIVEPDLVQIERLVVEAAAETQPLVTLESTTRERFVNEMRELEGKRDALVEKRDLYQRQLDAAIAGLNVQIADHNSTIEIYRGGLAPQISQES